MRNAFRQLFSSFIYNFQLSEDVLQRMRGVANIAPEHKSATSASEKATGNTSDIQYTNNNHNNEHLPNLFWGGGS